MLPHHPRSSKQTQGAARGYTAERGQCRGYCAAAAGARRAGPSARQCSSARRGGWQRGRAAGGGTQPDAHRRGRSPPRRCAHTRPGLVPRVLSVLSAARAEHAARSAATFGAIGVSRWAFGPIPTSGRGGARHMFGSFCLNGNFSTFPRRSLPRRVEWQNSTANRMQQVLCNEDNSYFALNEDLH